MDIAARRARAVSPLPSALSRPFAAACLHPRLQCVSAWCHLKLPPLLLRPPLPFASARGSPLSRQHASSFRQRLVLPPPASKRCHRAVAYTAVAPHHGLAQPMPPPCWASPLPRTTTGHAQSRRVDSPCRLRARPARPSSRATTAAFAAAEPPSPCLTGQHCDEPPRRRLLEPFYRHLRRGCAAPALELLH